MKIIGKLFAHLLAGILTLVLVAFDLLGRALSFIGVFVILLFGLSLLVIVFKGLWHTLPILIGLFCGMPPGVLRNGMDRGVTFVLERQTVGSVKTAQLCRFFFK